ncbi:MAG: hypothetical protein R3D84_00720 [Paracoccaceae bacterium]
MDAIRNIHPPLADTFALRFQGSAKTVVFSGDTARYPPLADFARGADLLIRSDAGGSARAAVVRVGNTDGRLMAHLLRSHTFAADAAQLATAAGVGALALHHLIPTDDPDFTEADWDAAVRLLVSTFHLGGMNANSLD